MQDEFLTLLDWFAELLKRPLSDFFSVDSLEHQILSRLKDGWGRRDTAELLKELSAEYGEAAGEAVEKFLELNLVKDWAEIGKEEAHEGTEIEDFIRVLWEPLQDLGFQYEINHEGGRAEFVVTHCPVHQLAERTGMRDWLYHLACSTDFFSTRGFSDKIEFTRSKTLIQGNDCCDHSYYYKTGR